MTKIIGLTGGIGSGKSTIASYFNHSVFLSILPMMRRELSPHLPKSANKSKVNSEQRFEGSGLNRRKLAQLVFSDPEKLKQLNAIIHPAVKSDF
jgi:dephospho-CoA kinase